VVQAWTDRHLFPPPRSSDHHSRPHPVVLPLSVLIIWLPCLDDGRPRRRLMRRRVSEGPLVDSRKAGEDMQGKAELTFQPAERRFWGFSTGSDRELHAGGRSRAKLKRTKMSDCCEMQHSAVAKCSTPPRSSVLGLTCRSSVLGLIFFLPRA
jgi:hypothetical protein